LRLAADARRPPPAVVATVGAQDAAIDAAAFPLVFSGAAAAVG